MQARLNFYQNTIAAKFSEHIHLAGKVVSGSTLAHSTQELMRIRASQINCSSVCADVHLKDAAHLGETLLRLNLIATWRDSTTTRPSTTTLISSPH